MKSTIFLSGEKSAKFRNPCSILLEKIITLTNFISCQALKNLNILRFLKNSKIFSNSSNIEKKIKKIIIFRNLKIHIFNCNEYNFSDTGNDTSLFSLISMIAPLIID